MNYVKHRVIKFKRQNHLNNVTYDKLLLICHRKGYMVKNYSTSQAFLIASGVWEEAQTATSVSVVDEVGNALIFLKDDLFGEKRLFALAHELGHITLSHKVHNDKRAEKEANQFAHMLLESKKPNTIVMLLVIILATLSIGICLFLNGSNSKAENQDQIITESKEEITVESQEAVTAYAEIDSEVCYFTKYGEVYHTYRDCYYLKNSINVFTGTVGTCYKDRLCSACNRRNSK